MEYKDRVYEVLATTSSYWKGRIEGAIVKIDYPPIWSGPWVHDVTLTVVKRSKGMYIDFLFMHKPKIKLRRLSAAEIITLTRGDS